MAQVNVPSFHASRRRTRTYDPPAENTEQILDAVLTLLVPAGTLIPTVLSEEPDGDAWKLCNGQALSKADFPRLYAAFGDRYGETESTFNLPDMSGRAVMGAGPDLPLKGVTGQAEVTLTVAQMPSHGHGVTDPGHTHVFNGTPHAHTVTDPGHAHTVTDPGHTHAFSGDPHDHAVTDPGHTHTVTDPGHAHPAETSGSTGAGSTVAEAAAFDASGATGAATTGITVEASATNITVQSATASGSNASAETGVAVDSATTSVSVDSATAGGANEPSETGVSVLETGGGEPLDITPPVIGVNWLVRT